MIKGLKSFGNLNPVLVMGKDAFMCFLEELTTMCLQNSIYKYTITIKTQQEKYEDRISYFGFNSVIILKFLGHAKFIGDESNEHLHKDFLDTFDTVYWEDFRFLKENWTFSDNIIIDYLIDPKSKNLQKNSIDPKIIIQTRKMLLKRSALLKKDFFHQNKYHL